MELFETALPLTAGEGGGTRRDLHPNRLHHFLWVLYPALIDRLMLSSDHQDPRRMADALTGDEQLPTQGLFDASTVSLRFVKRVLDDCGNESVKTTFFLNGDLPNYLRRSHKGHFYL